ncbi:deaminase reductase [Sphaerisporangium siamense]|uniref:Dihydrofolate reductase n=1 Tax=Sphaerisporangium siamense TaxID=795645 RepID=A0A7W7GB87_9ACTN|nr:dihydrofolate reductase family protein [Sphaerisporangium siamense]MBB4703207.1 dihydrofolate reductase [Sphaerisporangium siamense]GII89228.1 deaminase reductase [Sphaerisporangium siamense]
MKLTLTTFLSLDGVLQAPGQPDEDREGGFEHGGWLIPHADEDMGTFVGEWFEQADAFLFGRKTYEIFAAHWPNVVDDNDPTPTRLNKCPKYVVSRTLGTADWAGTTVIKDDVVEEVRRLKSEPGNELQVHGSGELARTLIEHGLVDEYRLWFFPVFLGSGKRLFEGAKVPATLQLVDSKKTSTGAVIHIYRPAPETPES